MTLDYYKIQILSEIMYASTSAFSLTVPAYCNNTLYSLTATEHSGVHDNTVSGCTSRFPKGDFKGSQVDWTRVGNNVTFTRRS